MSNEHNAAVKQFILRSLEHLEQGRINSYKITYPINDKEVILVEVRKIYKSEDY